MKSKFAARSTAVVVALLGLSACGGSSAVSLSAGNPGFFTGRVSDSTMVGTFNPAGFSGPQIRKLVGETCAGSLQSFGTQSRDDGLVAFSAACASWRSGARFVEFEKTGGSSVVVEITGSNSGNIVYDRFDATL